MFTNIKKTLIGFTAMAVFFTIFFTNNAKAKIDTIPLSVPPCTNIVPDCSDWEDWQYHTREMKYDSHKHSNWPFGPKWFKCNTVIAYRVRQCKTNRYMHQYDVININLDLGYKIWHLQSGGWVYPCREALDILKGSKTEVSGFFNALYNRVYEDLLEVLFEEYFAAAEALDEQLGGPYAHYKHSPCDDTDPNNPWNKYAITVVTVNSSCQGACVTWGDNKEFVVFKDPISLEFSNPLSTNISPEFLASTYGYDEGYSLQPLDTTDLADLNNYIQTEINPYIVEPEYKIGILSGSPKMTITKRPCSPDFCCVYKMNICQEENGDARLFNKVIEGDVPQACIDGDLTPLDLCPPSVIPPLPYPCVSNCVPAAPLQQTITETEGSINKIQISPNPTTNETKLTFTASSEGQLNITLVNVDGQELLELHNAHIEAGEFTKNISLLKFPAGIYYLRIKHNDNIIVEKIVRN